MAKAAPPFFFALRAAPEHVARVVAVVGPLDGAADFDAAAGVAVDVAPKPFEFDAEASRSGIAVGPLPEGSFVVTEEDLNLDFVHAYWTRDGPQV